MRRTACPYLEPPAVCVPFQTAVKKYMFRYFFPLNRYRALYLKEKCVLVQAKKYSTSDFVRCISL